MASPKSRPDLRPMIDALLAGRNDPSGLEERASALRALRAQLDGEAGEVDRALLAEIARLRSGVDALRDNHTSLKEVIERLTAPALHPAVFLGFTPANGIPTAIVFQGNTRRAVAIAAEVDEAALEVGDEVLLGTDLNVLLAHAPESGRRGGEIATFDRALGDGRAVLRIRDDEIVADLSAALRRAPPRAGESVRWDRGAWIVYETIERSKGEHFFLEDTPRETFADIGGLDTTIERLMNVVRLEMEHAEVTRRYGVRRAGAVLLVGPPGTGKTMLAKALANWLASIAPSRRARFMNVKPGALNSMWFGQSETNIREAFRVAREAGDRDPSTPCVMFVDEIDSIGAARGATLHRVEDRVLTAFMAELDGLEGRGNVLVVAATNRVDALDEALMREGRLADKIIDVPRPDRDAARAIFGLYLKPETPYACNGEGPAVARERLIDAAVSTLYAPNGRAEIATLALRDGRRHTVRARDVMSGARIARISREALERAALRDIETGAQGVTSSDLRAAIEADLEDAARALTVANCRGILRDLPADADVARVEPRHARPAPVHRYLDASHSAGTE